MARRALLCISLAIAGVPFLAPAARADGMLQVTPSGCALVIVTGSELPARARLPVVVRDAQSGRELGRATARASANGGLRVEVPARLGSAGVVEAELLRGDGRPMLTAIHEPPAAQRRSCGATTTALPFSGTARALTLLVGGALLLAVGAVRRLGAGYEGRHRPS